MRDQYAGDVSDLLKFSFLRALARDDRTIGVAWYFNPKLDRSKDGRHREYRDEENWASLDKEVWCALRDLGEPSVETLERLSIWRAGTLFHRTPMPAVKDRPLWVREMVSSLENACLVFLDPDNGIGNASDQHATLAEIAALKGKGRPVVVIRFPSRQGKHPEQLARHHGSLFSEAGALSIVTIRTSVSVAVLTKKGTKQSVPRERWFTMIDGNEQLIARAREFAAKLGRIKRCKVDFVHEARPRVRSPKVANICPECAYQFRGNGFDGIDAHWRARHERVMPYERAWELIKEGRYLRST